jgi:hypothetical protein
MESIDDLYYRSCRAYLGFFVTRKLHKYTNLKPCFARVPNGVNNNLTISIIYLPAMLVFRFDLFSFKIWFSSSQVGTVSSSISNKDLRMISRSSFDASRSMQEPKALSSTKTYYRRMEHLQDPERLQRTVSRNVTLRQLTQLPASHSMCAPKPSWIMQTVSTISPSDRTYYYAFTIVDA